MPRSSTLPWRSLPMVPNVMPNPREPGAKPRQPLVSIHLMIVPDLDPKTNGGSARSTFWPGRIARFTTGSLAAARRARPSFARRDRSSEGKTIDAFGGGAGMPMTISFQVEDYLPAAVEKQSSSRSSCPRAGSTRPYPRACIEMTVGDVTEEIWIQRSETPRAPRTSRVPFGDRLFEIAYDVSRRPLGFRPQARQVRIGLRAGNRAAHKFVSQVRLTDHPQGVKDEPHTISMNEPLTHRGFTFYQMRYSADPGPPNRPVHGAIPVGPSGRDRSRPPGQVRWMHLSVLGIFMQFYMRAGVFTDGGKKERERAAASKRKAPPPR